MDKISGVRVHTIVVKNIFNKVKFDVHIRYMTDAQNVEQRLQLNGLGICN